MQRGYVKLWRKTLDSGLLQNGPAWQVFGYLMLKASHRNHKQIVGGSVFQLQPGQLIFGRKKTAADLQLGEQQIRTAILLLKKLEIITTSITNKCTVISLVNWHVYQDEQPAANQQGNQQPNQMPTSTQPATNQHLTTNKNVSIKEEELELTTHESLVNQDHARALNVAGGETEEDFAPAPALLEEPCIEFVELREYWDRECKAEGPLSGWQEYKALKAARQWPGMGRIEQDVAERYATGSWEKGWAKALGNYLRERYWLAEAKAGPQKQPRASPRAPTVHQQNIADKDAMARALLAERGIHMTEAGSHEKHDTAQAYDIGHRARHLPHVLAVGTAD